MLHPRTKTLYQRRLVALNNAKRLLKAALDLVTAATMELYFKGAKVGVALSLREEKVKEVVLFIRDTINEEIIFYKKELEN